jgi:hypothetical protein
MTVPTDDREVSVEMLAGHMVQLEAMRIILATAYANGVIGSKTLQRLAMPPFDIEVVFAHLFSPING